jgi:hypothetical protein
MTAEKFVQNLARRNAPKFPDKGYGRLLNKIKSVKGLDKQILSALDPLLVNLSSVKPELLKQLLNN